MSSKDWTTSASTTIFTGFGGSFAALVFASEYSRTPAIATEDPMILRDDTFSPRKITAASSSQICDGSSAALIVSEAMLKEHGLTPLARIVDLTVTAGDPVIMLEEPLFATDKALKKAGLSIDDIDLYEVNEAFSVVSLAVNEIAELPADRVNVNGGSVALGHPIGASGARILITLLFAMQAREAQRGVASLCIGGGEAVAVLVER